MVRPGVLRRLGSMVVVLTVAIGVAAWARSAVAAPPSAGAAQDAGWLLDEVKLLAAPGMAGRAAGTPGADRAARHIAQRFQEAGLRPGGEDGYFQWFDVVTGVHLGEPNRLQLRRGALTADYAAGEAFMPFRFSASGRARGEVLFAGYGITAPELHYDDYEGIDARGKVVLVLTHEARERDPASPFRKPEAFHHTELREKVINAREHGAVAVIVVNDEWHHQGEPDVLTPLRGSGSAESGILAVHASQRVAAALLAGAGSTLVELQQQIDAALAPRSRPLPGTTVELELTLARERGRTANVVGILPGRDPRLRQEAVVIGAHYDHLGIGSESSLALDRIGEIHPGADDNASGTSAVLALARAFATEGGARRTLVFVTFSGEEIGLLGSAHYVKSPPLPLARTVAMLNLDSVGRMRGNRLYIMGVDSAREFRSLVAQVGAEMRLDLQLTGAAIGRSDHTSFFLADRPVLFFFTGPHADYHRPSDTWEKVNAEGLRRVAEAAHRVAARIADQEAAPTFVKAEGRAAGPPHEHGGYGPYFGAVPDFAESPIPGVRLGGVRPASPADKAGLRAGDVIVRFDGVAVRSLEDLAFALRSRRAGDSVEIRYLRDGAEHAAQATLEERR